MLGAPRAPLAFVEDRNVAEHAGPRAASGGLHRREPLHRKHRRHIERHRFYKIERETFAIGERPLIEMALHRPAGVLHDLAVLGPGQPSDIGWVIDTFEEIEEQLLAISFADEIHFRTLQFDKRGIQTRKDASKGQFDLRVGGANLTGQDLRVGIAGGTEETEADQDRLLPVDFIKDHLVRRVGVRLIKHHALVACLLEHRREGHDADGRKAHDPDTTVFCACFSREGVELWVTNVDQKYPH